MMESNQIGFITIVFGQSNDRLPKVNCFCLESFNLFPLIIFHEFPGDIEHFSALRYEDQKRIRQQIESLSGCIVPTTGKGKGKKRAAETAATSIALKDFGVEYAASGRATCCGCQIKILKDEIRVKKTVYDTEVGMKYGGQPLWHHVECFVKLRAELGFFECGDKLPGFKQLKKVDQPIIAKAIPVDKNGVPAVKKVKKEELDEVDNAQQKKLEDEIEKQSKALYKLRDRLNDNLTRNDLTAILEKNHQQPQEGKDALLEQVVDVMVFGALKPCEKCKTGQLIFSNNGYKCTGNLTEWVKCENTIREPPREKCQLPKKLREQYSFLGKYKSTVQTRAIRFVAPSGKAYAVSGPSLAVKKEEEGPKIKRERPPLYNMEFVILGKTEIPKEEIKERIRLLGGKVVTKIHKRTTAIISNPAEVEKMNSRMEEAKENEIQVVPEQFLDHAEQKKSGVLEYIQARSICDWGSDVSNDFN